MASEVSDDQILECQRAVANGILTKLNTIPKPGPVAAAIDMIAGRLVASGNSLLVLRRNSRHDYGFDALSILRTMYDVTLQGLYILADQAKQEERARLYLDFMWVERKQRIELMDSSKTWLAKRLSGSPMRANAEPAIEERFESVKAKYTGKNNKVRGDWFPGRLRDLARATGLEAEYLLMQKFLSGFVHSTPLTIMMGPVVPDFLLIDWHWRFVFRILGSYAEVKAVTLDEKENGLITLSRQNVFD
ncbi:MAG: DUF5677 domain-containing protein [Planctomycetota bacterium]|nr:DUF5677 domain-containing protein [Planctomycetota bacterium]